MKITTDEIKINCHSAEIKTENTLISVIEEDNGDITVHALDISKSIINTIPNANNSITIKTTKHK